MQAHDLKDQHANAARFQENIITVLPEPQHVRAVYKQILERNDLLTATPIKKERLFIDCSTIDPMTSAEVATQAHSSGQGRFVDAPMSGGVVGAAAGKLTFMIGAEEDIVSRVSEILMLMGKRVAHLGPPTSGLKGKLANNYLLALNNIATCEAMNMGIKWGLDPAKLADMINTATGKCWPSEVNNPAPGVIEGAPAGRGYEGGFGTALMLKDLKLALKAAEEADVSPFLGEKARELYTAVDADAKCKGKDFSVVYRYLGGKE
jgi:3-hydroxyisobutyrate dehydrogenase